MNNQNPLKFLNKAIPLPIGILIITTCTLLTGGILAWQYFEAPKEEVVKPEEKIPEEKIVETEEIKVYFHNLTMYQELQEEICPGDYCPGEMYKKYGVDDCDYVFPITREIVKPDTQAELAKLILRELKQGPTKEEQVIGFEQGNWVGMIKDVEIKDRVVTIEFDEEKMKEWERGLGFGRTFVSLSSCEWRHYLRPISATFEQISGIEKVTFPFLDIIFQ